MKVCVVGAGPSGLVALKELRAAGLDATAFEAQPGCGGLFRFREADGLVWDTLRLTSSSVVTQFSDFPPEVAPPFWRHDEYVAYLNAYATHFDLTEHLRFQAPVTRVERAPHGWHVWAGADGPRRFDALVISSGIHRQPHIPHIPGLERFRGQVLSAAHYRRAHPFRGLRVVCVGGGESAGDIAPQVAEVAAACTVSLRRGACFQPRFINGVPGDYQTNRLKHGVGHAGLTLLRRVAYERAASGASADGSPDHHDAHAAADDITATALARTGLARWQQFATKTSGIPESVARGRCTLKPGIANLEGHVVWFDDGSTVEADVLLFCTGFERPSWPFLGPLSPSHGLYRHVFAPDLGASMAFVGFARPAIGAIPVIAEMQARWVARVMSGHASLPAPVEMHRRIEMADAATRAAFPKDVEQLPYLVRHAEYLDALAREIGCMPDVRDLRTTPGLLRAFYTAPFTALQYRIVGPNALPDARERMLRLPLPTE